MTVICQFCHWDNFLLPVLLLLMWLIPDKSYGGKSGNKETTQQLIISVTHGITTERTANTSLYCTVHTAVLIKQNTAVHI